MRLAVGLSALLLSLLAAASAGAGVRVVPSFELERYADEAALGLLVPGAGPEVTREGALSALLRGELEHDLLGGVATGENLIELGEPGGPEILVSLPPEGRSENDRRYPIALLGSEGLLTSDSTRIDGLVSITDVATGRLRATPSGDPVAALERLDERIDRNESLRLPLTLLLAAALVVLALVRPPLALRALLVALAANLLLSPWLALAAVAAVVLLPLGLACAAILAAYLVSLGLDAETVALSPLGPSQSGRFYGINNLLGTLLLVPALIGTALLGRAALLVAGLALVTVGGNRFGADGGGLLVLAAGLAVLGLRLNEVRLTARSLVAVAAAVVAVVLALVALDALTGGESHVTTALSGGPGELIGDLADRIELSVRRTLASPGALVVVLGGVAVLIGVALRGERTPVLDAFLVALAVSLVVNDTPSDVIGIGAVLAFALARAAPWLPGGAPPPRKPVLSPFLETHRR
ncbi:MAG TPA: hypothetical protein VNP93_08980 [Gaiellaceae bacterium]|nr:hypothetical protein [Gaiellaceae bacterium]